MALRTDSASWGGGHESPLEPGKMPVLEGWVSKGPGQLTATNHEHFSGTHVVPNIVLSIDICGLA